MMMASRLTPESDADRVRRDRRVLEIAGAVAALLLVAALMVRGSVGLHQRPDERIVTVDPRTGEITSGEVELRNAVTAPLFDDVQLAPGDKRSECIAIDYRGGVVVDSVLLQLSDTAGSGKLMDALEVTVDRGVADTAGCDGFVRETRLVSDSLARLASGSDLPRSPGWRSWTPTNGDRAVYRFTVALPEDAGNKMQGDRVTTDFRWIATAEPVGGDLGSRLGLLLLAVARDSIIPLLLLIVVAVLFLGIQDRIDRRDPKLAHAAVTDEPELFLDRALITVAGEYAPGVGAGGS